LIGSVLAQQLDNFLLLGTRRSSGTRMRESWRAARTSRTAVASSATIAPRSSARAV